LLRTKVRSEVTAARLSTVQGRWDLASTYVLHPALLAGMMFRTDDQEARLRLKRRALESS
jgi:hypothetical protein